MTTTAEGVETEQQRNLLHVLGCTEMQGYLFSPAIATGEYGSCCARTETGRYRQPETAWFNPALVLRIGVLEIVGKAADAGDIPVGDYSPNRLSDIGIGHGAINFGLNLPNSMRHALRDGRIVIDHNHERHHVRPGAHVRQGFWPTIDLDQWNSPPRIHDEGSSL